MSAFIRFVQRNHISLRALCVVYFGGLAFVSARSLVWNLLHYNGCTLYVNVGCALLAIVLNVFLLHRAWTPATMYDTILNPYWKE
jgi:hypothetical protein